MIAAGVLALGPAAWAQESPAAFLATMTLERDPDPASEPAGLPSHLAEPVDPDPDPEAPSFSIGPVAGFRNAHGADHGTWFGAVQASPHLVKFLAAEASSTFHRNEDGDVTVTQYPVQLIAFLYLLSEGPIRPVILGGIGWYYTRVEHDSFLGLRRSCEAPL